MEYPKGKSVQLPNGSLSLYVPGSGKIVDRRAGAHKETSAFHCGAKMSAVVPGCDVGPTTYKRD